MGYYIRALPWKKSDPAWKVQFTSYRKEDLQNSPAKKPKKEWDIPPERWRSLGFHSCMTLGEARARSRQLNAQILLKRQEERSRKIEREKAENRLRHDSTLPAEFVLEFEKRFIRARDADTEAGRRRKTRARMLWEAAQRMIVGVQIDPSDWFYYTHEIYDYFHQRQLSLKYTQAILRFANLWGFFISRKLGRPFLPVPQPRGYERQRIADAFYEKERCCRKVSKPITPELLQSTQGRLNQKNLNWIFLTIWLGLRPKEVDSLKNKNLWRVETLFDGKKVLWVFQTKNIAVPLEDRWKPIPILFDEQAFALRIVEDDHFKRPLSKTMKKHFGMEIDLYGGRKGFTDLMLSRGQRLENISIWMGHSTLARTWRSYKDKKLFHLPAA